MGFFIDKSDEINYPVDEGMNEPLLCVNVLELSQMQMFRSPLQR